MLLRMAGAVVIFYSTCISFALRKIYKKRYEANMHTMASDMNFSLLHIEATFLIVDIILMTLMVAILRNKFKVFDIIILIILILY